MRTFRFFLIGINVQGSEAKRARWLSKHEIISLVVFYCKAGVLKFVESDTVFSYQKIRFFVFFCRLSRLNFRALDNCNVQKKIRARVVLRTRSSLFSGGGESMIDQAIESVRFSI